MIHISAGFQLLKIMLIGLAAMGLMLSAALPALSHGGKDHGDTEFTSFQAVRKASELYDRLIVAGKLDGVWETGLSSITVNSRVSEGKKEFVVKFIRSQGEPDSVYFFFDLKGEYTGSNFTGK